MYYVHLTPVCPIAYRRGVARLFPVPFVFVAMLFIARTGTAQTNDPPAVSTTATPTNPTAPPVTTSKAVASNFDDLKKLGDRALAERRLNDAIRAYMGALDIREDPLVSGRLGLALVLLEDPKLWLVAAPELHDAVAAAAGSSQAERRQFFEAYTRVRRHVCRLEVKVSDVNVAVDLGDGKMVPSGGAFWSFIGRGSHELVGRLDGHDDIRKSYECLHGENLSIEIAFPAPDKPAPEVVTIVRSAERKTVIIREPIEPSAPPSRSDKPWRFAGGVSALLGVASSPAIGVAALASYRWPLSHRWAVSVDGGLLAGWTPVAIDDAISTSAFVASGAVCLHYRIAFGCPAFAVGSIRYSFVSPKYATLEPSTSLLAGPGLRFGLEHFFWPTTGIRVYGEIFKLGDMLSVEVRRNGSPWVGTDAAGAITVGIVK